MLGMVPSDRKRNNCQSVWSKAVRKLRKQRTGLNSVDKALAGRGGARSRRGSGSGGDGGVLGVVFDASRGAGRSRTDESGGDKVSVNDRSSRVEVVPELVEDTSGGAVDVDGSSVLGLKDGGDLVKGVGLAKEAQTSVT